MSIAFAPAFDQMTTLRTAFDTLGLYQQPLLNVTYAYNAPTIDVMDDGKKWMYDNVSYNSAGASFASAPKFTLPAVADVPNITFGLRLRNYSSDANTNVFEFSVDGATPAGIPVTWFYPNVTPSGFFEIEIDRVAKTYKTYIDGIKVGSGILQSTQYSQLAKAVSGVCTLGAAYKPFPSANVAVASRWACRDFICILDDGKWPSKRTGPITIKDVPARVVSSSGVDKSGADLEAVMNQTLTATAQGQGSLFTKGVGVAKITGPAAEVKFSLDTSSVPVARQIACGVFLGVKRTGAVGITAKVERTLNGVTTSQIDPTTPISGLDRFVFIPPMTVKPSGAVADQRDLNAIEYKLKFAEAGA